VTNSSPYEVRCESCKTSFAAGTKTCVHCGRRLGGGLIAALGAASGPARSEGIGTPRADGAADETAGALRPGPLHEVEDDEEAQTLGGGRSPVWILTALFLVVSAVLRTCVEQ
jgi:hypothetical protein